MHAKNDPKMGRANFLKNFIIGFYEFMIINIERFPGINFVITVTETLYFLSHLYLLILLFWNLCVLNKLRHWFLNLKGHLKLIKNYNHYFCWYKCYCKWHFYHYFHIAHYRWINWITWTYTHCIFPFPFDRKRSYSKTKIIPIDLSPLRTQTHAHNCSQL